MTLFNFYVGYFVPATTLLPLVAGMVYYQQLNKPLKALMPYLWLSLLTNIAASVLAAMHTNNMPLLHVYTMLELLAIAYYYRKAFSSHTANQWITVIMVVYPILCIVNFSFIQSLYKFNTYTRPLEAIIIILITGIYLSEQSRLAKQELITASGRLVAYGMLIYFCSSLFQFIFSNTISSHASKTVKITIWTLHASFVLIMYIFFYLAIKRNEKHHG
jgi:hypothetical protein